LSKIEGYINLNFVFEGQTVVELAKEVGIPEAELEKTLATYNHYQKSGKDEQFKRPNLPRELSHAPYYAIEVTPAVHHTMGGITIDPKTRAQDLDGKIIDGLYAAGEATGGVHGANRLGGNAISDIVTFGRMAGSQAAEYVKKH